VIAAYRVAFAEDLVARRKAGKYEPEEPARLSHIRPSLYRDYESGALRPRMRPFMRLADALNMHPLGWLEEIAERVRPRGLTPLPFTAEAIMLFQGVTPEQMLRIAPDVPDEPDLASLPELGDQPLGQVTRFTRAGDPRRVRAAHQLRREYESAEQPTIGVLAKRHQMSFGTCRTLLTEADAPLRGPGRRSSKPSA